ncbi:MAG: COG1470 family protein [Janthinobacterium lividum]
MARTKGPQKLSLIRNPPGGTVLAASAGGQIEAEFDFINDSPEVAAFELAVEGISPDWLSGAGQKAGKMVAASGDGSLKLLLTPPRTASVGEYDFSVRIMSGGDTITPATSLVLRVDPADESSEVPTIIEPEPPLLAASMPEPELVPPPLKLAAPPKPAPRRRAVPLPEPEPVFAAEPIPEPAAELVPEPMPEPPAPKAPEPVVFSTPEPVAVAVPEPPRVMPEPSRPLADDTPPPVRSVQPVPRPVQPVPRPIAPPPVVEEAPILVDYQATPSRSQIEDDDQEPVEEETALIDLADGGSIALKPGETKLLRFTFVNESPREATYVLDEDQSLPEEWITLVQDQVNLTRNGKGDVSLRLSPLLNAEPGDYPFGITLGQQGGILTPRFLTLTVQATPAVKISIKDKTLKIGAMGSFADFPLIVESAGNVDTAFRIAVQPPRSDTDEAARNPVPVYGTAQWQYLFDKELETLRSPATGRAPRPVPIRLRLQRKGPWWFGFRETHQVHVVAVPVTDAGNGGKPGNGIDVTAVRQRFWPMPYLTLIPVFLLLMLLGAGGADDVSVATAQHQENDTYWVVNPPDNTVKSTTLKWDASPTAFLRVSGEKISGEQTASSAPADKSSFSQVVRGSGQLPCQVTVSRGEPDVEYHYKASRLMGGGDQDVFVHYIFTRRDTPLKAEYQDAAHKAYTLGAGANITVTVPKTGYAHLNLTNNAATYNDVDYWVVRQPNADTSAFLLQNIDPKGTIEDKRSKTPVISLTGKDDLDDNKIVLITSDANRPVLTITLKKEGAAAQ